MSSLGLSMLQLTLLMKQSLTWVHDIKQCYFSHVTIVGVGNCVHSSSQRPYIPYIPFNPDNGQDFVQHIVPRECYICHFLLLNELQFGSWIPLVVIHALFSPFSGNIVYGMLILMYTRSMPPCFFGYGYFLQFWVISNILIHSFK